MTLQRFLGELKRRKVYTVAVGYAVVGWVLVQVATQVFPTFEIPNWSGRLVVLLIALGFPGALVLAWTFDLTRTERILNREAPARTSTPRDIETGHAAHSPPRWHEGLNRGILDMALDGIITIDANGCVCEFNPAAERTFGFSALEIEGRELAELIIPPAYRERHRNGLQRYLKTGEGPVIGRRIEIPALHKDGTEMLVEMAITAFEVEGAPYFTAYLRDVSGRARGEEAVRLLAAIIESSEDAIMSEDLDGLIMTWNNASERLFGYSPEEAIGKSVKILIPPDRPDDQARVLARIRRGENIQHYETIRVRNDGSLVNTSLTISPIKNANNHVIGVSTIARDITERMQNERCRKTLYEVANLLASSSEITGAAKPILEIIAKMGQWIFGALWLYDEQDALVQCHVTWNAPLPQLSQFQKATRKMKLEKSVGLPGRVLVSKKPEWIADIARDENFPRHSIAAEAGLRSGFAFPTCAEGTVNGVIELFSADHVRPDRSLLMAVEALGNQIGIFIQRRQTEVEFGLARLARSKLELHLHKEDVHILLRSGIKVIREENEIPLAALKVRLDASHHHAFVDSPRLHYVFLCVLRNAFRFSSSNSEVAVQVHSWNHTIKGLCVEISDNGIGIEPQFLDKIFNAFEQIGPREEGIGLGLTISKTIVEMHGGTICAKSDGLGRGTTLTICLKLDRAYGAMAA